MYKVSYFESFNDLKQYSLEKNKKYLFFIGENCEFSFEKLKQLDLDFYGAIVPQVVYNERHSSSSILAIELNVDTKTILIKDIKNFELEKNKFKQSSSVNIILDGLSSHITPFLEDIFNTLPANTQIIGGGAGKLTLEQEPVIFSNEGMFKDAALIVETKSEISVGIENSWEYLQGPFIVSSSNKNILKSLNFTDAFSVYKDIVEKDSNKKFDDENFFDMAKSYPFGIVEFNKEIIVRDPIALDENRNIVLVGDIEQNSIVNILKGDKNSLISSCANAIKKALENSNCKEISHVVLYDCISRAIFLGDEFDMELKEIKKYIPNNELFGILTLGEIANNGNEYINFYNKTCVIGVLC